MPSPILAEWESFCVIVGSSAAALIGLQFVVMVLASDRRVGSEDSTASFGTPTIVHFTTVLGIAAMLAAPWHRLAWPVGLVTVAGVAGCVYVVRVVGATRRQHDYVPEFEDMVWHWCLPAAAYGLFATSWLFGRHPEVALFVIGGAVLLLLCVAIHNAWDSVVYVAQGYRLEEAGNQASPPEDSGD